MEMVEYIATAYGNGKTGTCYRLWKWLNNSSYRLWKWHMKQQLPFMEMVYETPATVYGNGNEQQSRLAEGVAVPSPGSRDGDTLS